MIRVLKCAVVLAPIALVGLAIGQVQQLASPAETVAPPHTVATLAIDATTPVAKVSPTLYGLMTEEINYSYEAGLYAELVQDRTFLTVGRDTENWIPVAEGTAHGSVARDRNTGPSAALSGSLKMTVVQADAANTYGVRNRGWWGVLLKANTAYTGSVYAKADKDGMAAGLKVSLIANQTGKVLASAKLPGLTGDWKKYDSR